MAGASDNAFRRITGVFVCSYVCRNVVNDRTEASSDGTVFGKALREYNEELWKKTIEGVDKGWECKAWGCCNDDKSGDEDMEKKKKNRRRRKGEGYCGSFLLSSMIMTVANNHCNGFNCLYRVLIVDDKINILTNEKNNFNIL